MNSEQTVTISNTRQFRWTPFLLIGLAVTAVWGQSLLFDFSWDDQYYIVNNLALRSCSNFSGLFTKKETQISQKPYELYRPLRTLHFALLTWPSGKPDPRIFHLANLLWQTACSILLFIWLRMLLRRGRPRNDIVGIDGPAFCGALIFAIHPVASEVVCWAKSLDDLMATAFLFLALIFFWNAWEDGRGKPKHAFFSLICFTASIFSKESTVAMSILFVFPWAAGFTRRRIFWAWFSSFILIALIFLFIRHQILGHTAQVLIPLSGSYLQTLIDMLPVVWMYMSAFAGLGPYLPDYSFMSGQVSFFSPAAVGGLIIILLGLSLLFYFLRSNPRFYFALWFALLWIVLSILPVSNFVPMMQYYAVRFAYLPLAGVLMAGVWLLAKIRKNRKLSLAAVLVLASILAGRGFAEASKWRNEPTLLDYGYTHAPASSRIVFNYLKVLDTGRQDDKIITLLHKHKAFAESDPMLRLIEARMMMRQAKTQEALTLLKSLRKHCAANEEYFLDMGLIYVQKNNFKAARFFFQKAAHLNPVDPTALSNLGKTWADAGDNRRAVVWLEKSAALDPENLNTLRSLSRAAWLCGDWTRARKAFERLVSLEPGNHENLYWLNETIKKNGEQHEF